MLEEYCMAFEVRPILWPFTTRPSLVFRATQAFCTAYASSMVMAGCWMESWRICVRERSDSSSRLAASRIVISSNMSLLLRFAYDGVLQASDSIDRCNNFVADVDAGEALRSAGQNDVTGRQGHEFAEVGDYGGNVEDHVARSAFL